jgi:hypothetical protein
MSRYVKKTERPYRYSPEQRALWVKHAANVSIMDAARKFKVSPATVRRCLMNAGHTPRRPGAFTIYDDAFAANVVAHRNMSGSTKATARALCVSEDTVKRFCKIGTYAALKKPRRCAHQTRTRK